MMLKNEERLFGPLLVFYTLVYHGFHLKRHLGRLRRPLLSRLTHSTLNESAVNESAVVS